MTLNLNVEGLAREVLAKRVAVVASRLAMAALASLLLLIFCAVVTFAPRPAAIFEAIARYRPTVFFGLPTLYTALTKADGAAA